MLTGFARVRQLRRGRLVLVVALLAVPVLGLGWVQSLSSEESRKHIGPGPIEDVMHITQWSLAGLPITFVANAGQMNENACFMTTAGRQTVFFCPDEVVFVADSTLGGGTGRSSVIRLRFPGSSSAVEVVGAESPTGVTNFFVGDDPEKWRANVPTYSAITYHDLYPGIDLVYGGGCTQLKSEFIVAAAADPTEISMQYSGANSVYLREEGALVIETAGGKLIEIPPYAYQTIHGKRVVVECAYCLLEGDRVGIALGDYDPQEPLVIDPVLVYSTYIGGSDDDYVHGIAVDTSGCAYITGRTNSLDFPTQYGYQSGNSGDSDVFVTKLSPAGRPVYSTYLGGGDTDNGNGIAVNGSGHVYVTGATASSDFPSMNAYQSSSGGSGDAFVSKLDASGWLVYSTYLGGSDHDYGNGVAVDASGQACVTGYTRSMDFPIQSAFQPDREGRGDVFVARLDLSGSSLVYSTYVGGEASQEGFGIAVDGSGNAYVTGYTSSAGFPTQNAYQPIYSGGSGDAFLTKLSPAGWLIYSTYLGGEGQDAGHGVAVDGSGSAFVIGHTRSAGFPTHNAYQSSTGGGLTDAFVTRFDQSGCSLVYSTYLGGEDSDCGYGIAVDGSGHAWVTGSTASSDFPTLNPCQSDQGGYDAFVTQLGPSGGLVYSTYLGGGDDDFGSSIGVDGNGFAYVAGNTDSWDFPTANAYQSDKGGDDAFVTRLDPSGTLNSPPVADAGQDQTVVDTNGNGHEPVALDGSGSSDPDGSIESYLWTRDGSLIATGVTPTVTLSVGTHTIILSVTDDDGATDTDEVAITIDGVIPNPPGSLCATSISASQVDLSWQDSSGNEDGFKIERKEEGGSYAQIDTVSAGVDTYSDTGLDSASIYCYRVWAYNSVGDSGPSNEACASTLQVGDINGDGLVDLIDVLMLYRYVEDVLELSPDELLRADINRDGDVDEDDALALAGIVFDS